MRRLTSVLATALALLASGVPAASADEPLGYGYIRGTITDARTGGVPHSNNLQVEILSEQNYGANYESVHGGSYGSSPTTETGLFTLTVHDYNGYYPDTRVEHVEVTDGGTTIQDIVLVPYPRIMGRVVDTAGEPLVGVCGTASVGEPVLGSYQIPCTDDQGRFAYGASEPGTYRIGFGGGFYPQWWRGAADEAHATPIVVGTEDVTEIDFVVERYPSIRATLVDEAGRPLKGCVSLRTADDVETYISACTDLYSDTTDGVVVFEAVQPGTWLLRGATPDGEHLTRYLGGTTTAAKATRVTVAHGLTDVGPLRLPMGGVITGVLTDAVTHEPASYSCATTKAWSPFFASYDASTACADSSGRYRIAGLEPGTYPVTAFDQFRGHAPVFLPSSPDTKDAKRYKVGLGQTVTLDVAMPTGGQIAVRLRTRTGEVPQQACVQALSTRTRQPMSDSPCNDYQGDVLLYALPTNSYEVVVTYRGDGGALSTRKPIRVDVVSGRTTSVSAVLS